MLTTPRDEKRIAEFLDTIRGKSMESARGHILVEQKWIHTRTKPDKTPYSPLTNRSLIEAYREAIRTEYGEDTPLLKYMVYSQVRATEYKQHQIAVRRHRHHNLRPLDAPAFVAAATELLTDVAERWELRRAIVAVCALTGRRPYEVACTGVFAPDPHRADWILFSGQAKTRDPHRAAEVHSIPVLACRDLVLDVIARIRAGIEPGILNAAPKKRNDLFKQKHANRIGYWSKRVFVDAAGDEIIPAALRKAYSAVAVLRFAPASMSDVQFVNEVLGHQEDTLDTALHYTDFRVVID